MKNLLPPAIRIAALCAMLPVFPRAAEPYDPGRFEREVLVASSRDALQLEVLANGDILFAEFQGAIKLRDAKSGLVSTLGRVATHAKGEVGLLGMAAAPDFAESGHLYVLFCPEEKQDTMRVSRFTVKDGRMPAESEHKLLDWPYDTEHVFHMGGAMFMDAKGDLYIGNGDNCHWNPGLPIDLRPGRKNWDALRSAGNSRDLRGKILRIHPLAGGGYRIPEGNLYPDGGDGAPEIFAMGIRNPFRMTVDNTDGTLYFGDVGPNVMPELGIEPFGYEEINATREAGNFGWPLFIGPNEAYPIFDFDKKAVVRRYDPAAPENPSPNNTGARNLPPAKPALIWYSTTPSAEFPTLGSGGRSIMAGPVYRFDPQNPSTIKLPEELDGHLFIYEWMRNWIQTVKLGSKGPAIEPFLADWNWRRPIDMKLGADGALYLIEYGDQWWENADSRIVRVIYRRGNRPPAARLTATETAGRHPLAVAFDATASADPDGDALTYKWQVVGGDAGTAEKSGTFRHTFDQPGRHEVTVTATDPSGSSASVTQTIEVGNARPAVRFESPAHGSFFDWGAEIPYRIAVSDTDSPSVDPATATVRGEFRGRRFVGDGDEEAMDPGLALMRKSTCFACHLSNAPSAGPPYQTVAAKYRDDAAAPERLAQKIIGGGAGAWGPLPMPPHPQHTLDQARLMVAWVLSQAAAADRPPKMGAEGSWSAPAAPADGERVTDGVMILTAGYTDAGAEGAPPLRGETSVVLHSRRKKAALYDLNRGMAYIEQVEGEKGILGHFEDGDHIIFCDLRLDGIRSLVIRAGGLTGQAGRLELRKDNPGGTLLASVEVTPTGDGEFVEIPAELAGGGGLTDVCVVARFDRPAGQVLGLNWIEFRE
jgi:cytochrome c